MKDAPCMFAVCRIWVSDLGPWRAWSAGNLFSRRWALLSLVSRSDAENFVLVGEQRERSDWPSKVWKRARRALFLLACSLRCCGFCSVGAFTTTAAGSSIVSRSLVAIRGPRPAETAETLRCPVALALKASESTNWRVRESLDVLQPTDSSDMVCKTKKKKQHR